MDASAKVKITSTAAPTISSGWWNTRSGNPLVFPGGGGNITELLAFGRIVGQNAAKESA